jgi:outer membrane protein
MRFAIASVLFLSAAPATAQPAPQVLTLDRAIELAFQQQPSLRATKANIEAATARIFVARVPLKPTVTLSASADVGSTRPAPCASDITKTCGGFFDPTGSTGLGAQINWRIYDFGQTRANIRAAELSALATETTLTTEQLDVRVRVEQAYLEAVARGRLVQVAEATVKSEDQHLDQARKFVAAQAKDPIEVVQAQARAANAKSALAQAQSAQAIALANLRAAIGWVDATRPLVVGSGWPTPPVDEPPALPALVDVSRKQRPEILQLDRQIAAAEANVTAAEIGNRPVLSATASTQWNPDTSDWSPQPSWVAGLTLSWQVFDGGRAKAEARVARAQVVGAIASRDALLVTLTAQLESARAQIVANRAAVQASDEAVIAARAQLKLADARYAQGLGSQIELADAQTAITTAEGNLVQAEWHLADAWAQLRRARGGP